MIKICERCGKPITNPKPNQKFHKEGDPENEKCWRERMQLSWQQASSNYRLKKKKWQNNEIKEKIRKVTKGEIEKSHDGTGGRLGTGSLGKHRNKDDDIEGKIIKRELKRCGLI